MHAECATVKPSVQGARAGRDFIHAPVLAVDLDGTIRYNGDSPGDFIEGPESVAVYEGVEQKLWEYRKKGYLPVGVSNQGGVAFDFKTPRQDHEEVQAMLSQFARDPFMMVTTAYSHPEGDTSPWDRRSLMRKPNIGMLALVEAELLEEGYTINWDDSIVVGDREEDQEMANRAKIEFRWSDAFFGRK